jgi:hypothetical protein
MHVAMLAIRQHYFSGVSLSPPHVHRTVDFAWVGWPSSLISFVFICMHADAASFFNLIFGLSIPFLTFFFPAG